MAPETVTSLARAGLRVIDLGLESASTRQLAAMKKARDPKEYLKKASGLLRQCRDLGVWTKVNILLYAGETDDTVRETLDWLNEHRDYIKGLSVGPVTIYGHGQSARNCLTELQAFGASAVDAGSLDNEGYAHLHLSPSMEHEKVESLAIEIAKKFMTDRDWYDLKAFTYLPRGYTYEQFRSESRLATADSLPFGLS